MAFPGDLTFSFRDCLLRRCNRMRAAKVLWRQNFKIENRLHLDDGKSFPRSAGTPEVTGPDAVDLRWIHVSIDQITLTRGSAVESLQASFEAMQNSWLKGCILFQCDMQCFAVGNAKLSNVCCVCCVCGVFPLPTTLRFQQAPSLPVVSTLRAMSETFVVQSRVGPRYVQQKSTLQ
jgi:hypothetical protein